MTAPLGDNMIGRQRKVICVAPVFEDADVASQLIKELVAQFGEALFIVAVDDGSVGQPLQPAQLEDAGADGVILRLRRNVGHQRAIAVGLGFVAEHGMVEQTVVVLDADGEDRPETVPELLEVLQRDNVDIAVAQRKNRSDTLFFKLFYAIYKRFFRIMTGRRLTFGNFMALRMTAVNRLVAMQELPTHLAGTALASRLRLAFCPTDRGRRYTGASKMSYVGLVLHGLRALMVFAEDVLVRVCLASALIAITAMAAAAVATLLKLTGFSTPGWFSIALGVLVMMFLQTGTLAMVSLLLAGLMRSSAVIPPTSYRNYIAQTLKPGGGKRAQ